MPIFLRRKKISEQLLLLFFLLRLINNPEISKKNVEK